MIPISNARTIYISGPGIAGDNVTLTRCEKQRSEEPMFPIYFGAPPIDISDTAAQLVLWIREQVSRAEATGCVVGLSGGVDSALVAALCKRAYPENTFLLIMPFDSDPTDEEDAKRVASALDASADVKVIPLRAPFTTPSVINGGVGGNLKTRCRMATLYYWANSYSRLVVGTGNMDELYTGYFTKYGDGACDINPIAYLLKREVQEMARFLGIPDDITRKAPSAGLWAGQTDEEEMGVTYEHLDLWMEAKRAGRPLPLIGEDGPKIERMHDRNRHKLAPPYLPNSIPRRG